VGAKLIEECNVTDDAAIERLFAKVKDTYGTIDALVHAIAYAERDDLVGRFVDTSREGFKTALDVSAYSLVALAHAAEPLMPDGGSIVAMTYGGSLKVAPHYNVMGVAKAALESSVRYLAYDLGPEKIRVNAISAGPIKTLAAAGVAGFRRLLSYSERTSPLRKLITQEDVGKCALWLLSDWGGAVTGEVVYVDAGWNILGLTVPMEDLQG
jgi:enoyl-[acyl-carrier protein] reductase I